MLDSYQGTIPSFENPIALLLACHEKVRRFADLTVRLDKHLTTYGIDDEARAAAGNILRYFDVAAPLHHADEEADLFPALRELGKPQLTNAIDDLENEHDALAKLWLAVRPWLDAIAHERATVRPPLVNEFASRYIAHANREEREVYPDARSLSPAVIQALGLRMSQRRGQAL